jgi:integrase
LGLSLPARRPRLQARPARTIEKLRWLLAKAIAALGDRRLSEHRPHKIAAWRMRIPPGHRFEATQALRQVLTRAVVWRLLTDNPAKLGGLRPGEWLALERRDVDREARVLYVRRAFTNGRLKHTKTEASVRAVPLQAIALAALEELPRDSQSRLLFPSPRPLSRPSQLPKPPLETGATRDWHRTVAADL